MAENQSNEANAQQQNQQQEPDYKALYEQLKADARKWEDRAKANKQKADKYDEMAAGSSSVEERIAALEAENKAMKDAKAHAELVAKVAAATALPEALVATLSGSDEETLTTQAQAISALKPKGAPSAPEAGKFPRDSNADEDAEMKKFVRDLFGESR
jgi:hypothetical protein